METSQTAYVALFRGINVGGNNILPMQNLRNLMAEEGYGGGRTYIQSGNAVFNAEPDAANVFSESVGAAIFSAYGFRPKILIIAAERLARALADNPFPNAETEPKTLHLYFLTEPAANPDLDGLEARRAENEAWQLGDGVFYLHAPGGIWKSKLAANAEKLLGVEATARNWRTCAKLLEMTNELPSRPPKVNCARRG